MTDGKGKASTTTSIVMDSSFFKGLNGSGTFRKTGPLFTVSEALLVSNEPASLTS